MPTPDEISHQRELLTIYRRTLRVYLSQLAIHSMAYVPPSVSHGIHEAREAIRRIKAALPNLISPGRALIERLLAE